MGSQGRYQRQVDGTYLAARPGPVVQVQVLPASFDARFSWPPVMAVLTPALLILACSVAEGLVVPAPALIVTVDVYLPVTVPMTSEASAGHMPLSATYSDIGI